ncbi:hypothetical protein [Pedobacter endophyticus]|uniref:DUF4304 domain-containing protein n=1 Tax=Pedobacter endophyticus TaxID=2789740 RepID=A0A7S9KYY3_9SPHI|nr:hypothetical protein [Pedobacter endophyticus]QPH39437.1 hypothetical protein IZT61_20735 [Pedobacter endophyticus]
MVFNKENFEDLILQLKPKNFNYKGGFGSVRFVKEEADKILTIAIGYNQYFPHSAVVKGVSVDIYFAEVENILKQNGFGEECESTFGKVFQDLHGVDYEKLETEINSEKTFNVVRNVIEDILEKGVKPFLSRFTTINEIADFLADKRPIEIVPFIQGSILYPKTILIMKLADHPNFRKRLVEFRTILSENVDENVRYPILLNKYDELFHDDLKQIK